MPRPVSIVAFLALALQVSQAQLFSHGAPASVMSPTPDGREHGVPASVVSPTPLPFGVHPPLRSGVRVHGPMRRFGNQRSERRHTFVAVPVFYPFYADNGYNGDNGYPSVADPSVPDTSADAASTSQANAGRSDDELRAAYLQGARDAMTSQGDSRYGDHYMDSRERKQQPAEKPAPKSSANPDSTTASAAPVEDKSPATVFIFKDGHQLETRNYAIMNGTLFDFSGKLLKKIQLDDLDSAATLKANDDRGVQMKLN
jgi:hypothetical protein